jgi:hypothetical protein
MPYVLRNRPQRFSVLQQGLLINLDAGVHSSYPGSGVLWADLSGNSNNAVLTGGPTYTSELGGGIVFSATGHYAQGQTVVEPAGQVTANIWFKADAEGTNNDFGGQTLFVSSPELNHGWLLAHVWLNSNAATSFTVNQGLFSANSTFARNQVHNLTGVKSAGQVLLYRDGQLLSTMDQSFGPTYPTSGDRRFRVAKWGYSTFQREFRGTVYAANLYGRALSAAEVQENFERMRGRFGV